MQAISEQMQNDLLQMLSLQRRISTLGVGSSNYESWMRTLLKQSGEFVVKYNPTSYTICMDAEGQPKVSFTWSP